MSIDDFMLYGTVGYFVTGIGMIAIIGTLSVWGGDGTFNGY